MSTTTGKTRPPWPKHILQAFSEIPENGYDKDWHPPYSALLATIFPFEQGFMIAPQLCRNDCDAYCEGNLGYIVQVEQTLQQGLFRSNTDIDFNTDSKPIPIFGLDIKKAADIDCPQKRWDVIEDIQDLFRQVRFDYRCDRSNTTSSTSSTTYFPFRVISAIGTRCCVFTEDIIARTARITLENIDHGPDSEIDTNPASRWNIDIATPEGRTALGAYFEQAKTGVSASSTAITTISSASPTSTSFSSVSESHPVSTWWPVRLQNNFARIDRIDTRHFTVDVWYPAYWALLTSVFPPEEGYSVTPQVFPVTPWGHEYGEDALLFIVRNKNGDPVFGMEPRLARQTNRSAYRARDFYDREIRSRFPPLMFSSSSTTLPKLHLVSTIGTRYRVYTCDSRARTISPPRMVPMGPHADVAPIACWDFDILTEEGRVGLNAYFIDAKEMSMAALVASKP
ncbi:hypothetical protein BGZ83_006009 [Gryganskiella cystojenkinii]|nr:hypothetical protein BGZ83_006009 [Gryganskiella cystojenkinii]